MPSEDYVRAEAHIQAIRTKDDGEGKNTRKVALNYQKARRLRP